jgi:hypothetical protein
MWIEHLGEIAIGVFVGLIAVHFGLHLLFKHQKNRRKAQKTADSNDS